MLSANGDGVGRTVTGVSPQIEINGTAARTGNYGLQVAPTASLAGRLEGPTHTEVTVQVGSIYVYFNALPSADSVVIQGEATAGAANPSIVYNSATGKLALAIANSDNTGITGITDFGVAVSTGTWYLVDYKFDVSSNPWTLRAYLDGANENNTTYADTADTIDAIRFGHTGTSGPAHTTYFDDVVISATSGDYPIGAHAVAGLLPTADGTHNAGTNIIEDNAGTDIGTTTAYDKVDDVPMSTATTYIQQLANGTGNYAEVQFADLSDSHSAVWGAQGVLAYTSAGAPANRGATIMSKDDFSTESSIYGTPATTVDMSDGSTSNVFYKSAIVAGVTDDTTVNGLEARIGYSGDANPDPYWINLLVEVAYVPLTGATLTVADAHCVSQVDAPVVTTIYNAIVADAFSISQADALDVTTNYVLTVADAFSTSQVDEVILSADLSITVEDAFSTSQVDAQDIIVDYVLVVADSFSTSQADAQDVTTIYTLVVVDAFSTSQTDAFILQLPGVVEAQDASVVTQVDAVSVTTDYILSVNDSAVTTQADARDVTTDYILVVVDGFSTSQVDALSLDGASALTISDAFVVSQVDTANATTVYVLTVADASVVSQADAQDVTTVYNLVVADAHVVDVADLFGLSTVYVLTVPDSFSVSQSDVVTLVTVAIRGVDSARFYKKGGGRLKTPPPAPPKKIHMAFDDSPKGKNKVKFVVDDMEDVR